MDSAAVFHWTRSCRGWHHNVGCFVALVGKGSSGAVLTFLTTLSFLFSTPGWEPSLGGFPALSGSVGRFLIKDVVLLRAAIWSLGEALAS